MVATSEFQNGSPHSGTVLARDSRGHFHLLSFEDGKMMGELSPERVLVAARAFNDYEKLKRDQGATIPDCFLPWRLGENSGEEPSGTRTDPQPK